MSKINFLLFIFSLISIICLETPIEESCQKIECSQNLPLDTCIKVESTTSLLKPCPESQICSYEIEDPIIDSKCKDQSKDYIPFKKLPSLPCKENKECISDKCVEGKCIGVNDGEKCKNSHDCNYGKTCRKEGDENKCLAPVKEGEKCEKDTDCELNCGCKEGKCTKYFSLNNWEKTGGTDYLNDFNFCKSGYVNEVGICMNISLKNQTTECSFDSPCVYEYKDDQDKSQSMIIHQNCLCGYNPFGKKYCLIGSGNYNYTRYLDKLKAYHLNNANCHLSERTSEGCQKDLLSNNEKILLQIHELINAKYWAKYNNRMIEAPECVYSIELKEYNRSLDKNTKPEPILEGKCAKYTCNNDIANTKCAKSNYKSKSDISVVLSDICEQDIKCNIDGIPNDVFYNGSNIEGKCSNLGNKRYPGEKCTLDSECIYPLNNPSTQFHKCEEGICNGIKEDGICEDNSWCLVGYYCDKFEGKCKSQKSKGNKCSESKDCKNNLVCIDNKCDELFTLDDGKKVPEYETEQFKKMFCKNGEVIDNTCVSFNDLDGTKVDDNEYKKCDYSSFCEYKINGLEAFRKLNVPCGCGYNDKGQGYCPHYHDYAKEDWDKYRDIIKDRSKNGCHTESRFNCYENDGKKGYELKEYKNKLENGHLFYDCVECAKKVLKANYLNINMSILSLLFALALFLV